MSQAVLASDEAVAKLDSKEKELSNAVQRVTEVEGKWEEAQSALEREQVLCIQLQGDRDTAVHSQNKVREGGRGGRGERGELEREHCVLHTELQAHWPCMHC